MDGTLVEYRQGCTMSDLKKKNYFASLKPEWNMIEAMLKLNKQKNNEVYILTKVYPKAFPYSIGEKREYISKHIPEMVNRVIMVNGDEGETKSDKIKEMIGEFNSDCLLIDDFTENLNEWEAEGGTPIKYLNGINNTNGTIHKNSISCYMDGNKIYDYLYNLKN